MTAPSVPLRFPTHTIREYGPFYYHVYIATHYLVDDAKALPLNLFVGTAKTWRGARRLAEQEIAKRTAPKEAEMPIRRYRANDPRREFQRTISALMDDAPDWRDWLAWQLYLLDLEYDPDHWIEMEWVR